VPESHTYVFYIFRWSYTPLLLSIVTRYIIVTSGFSYVDALQATIACSDDYLVHSHTNELHSNSWTWSKRFSSRDDWRRSQDDTSRCTKLCSRKKRELATIWKPYRCCDYSYYHYYYYIIITIILSLFLLLRIFLLLLTISTYYYRSAVSCVLIANGTDLLSRPVSSSFF